MINDLPSPKNLYGKPHKDTDWFFQVSDVFNQDTCEKIQSQKLELFDDLDARYSRCVVDDTFDTIENELTLETDDIYQLAVTIMNCVEQLRFKFLTYKLYMDIVTIGKYGYYNEEPSNSQSYILINVSSEPITVLLARRGTYKRFMLAPNKLYLIKNVNGCSYRVIGNQQNNTLIIASRIRKE